VERPYHILAADLDLELERSHVQELGLLEDLVDPVDQVVENRLEHREEESESSEGIHQGEETASQPGDSEEEGLLLEMEGKAYHDLREGGQLYRQDQVQEHRPYRMVEAAFLLEILEVERQSQDQLVEA
jgi:hypothetical protein